MPLSPEMNGGFVSERLGALHKDWTKGSEHVPGTDEQEGLCLQETSWHCTDPKHWTKLDKLAEQENAGLQWFSVGQQQ